MGQLMSSTPHEPSSRDQRVNEAIAVYIEAMERGQRLDRERFLADHSDLQNELHSFLANHDQFVEDAGAARETCGEETRIVLAEGESLTAPDGATQTSHQSGVPAGRNVLRQIGDYELLHEIARGGMGVVFKARQASLNRTVAVKMILGGQIAGPDDVQRFHTEAEAAAQLDHSGIVPIYEVGEHEGQHYFSMGFVEGRSLAQQVAGGPLDPKTAADIVQAVSEAVQYAHDRGVIHRDLKPGNILLDRHGKPRVTDFGLAKLSEGGSELTGTGQILGTPSYMPPEQAAGWMNEVGRHSDIYSLGAILYCLLTGRPPFQAATAVETFRQVLEHDPVPPRLFNSSVPRDLETICLKCLRKEPAKRYARAAELCADLRRFLAGEPIFARRVGGGERTWKWIKRRPAVAAMIAISLLAVVGSGIAIAVIRSEAAEEEARTLVSAYFRAPAAAVPYVMKDLRPFRRQVIPLLRARLEDSVADETERFRAACALADMGETPLDALLDAVPRLPVAECANLLSALEIQKAAAAPELLRRADAATDSEVKARYAILALHLGDPAAAKAALALRADPIHRTRLIHAYGRWHGRLAAVAELLRGDPDEAFRSGMCAAFGTIPREELEQGDLEAATSVLQEFFVRAPDGGTHSAAEWALKQWKAPVPAVEPTSVAPAGRRWFVNRIGMTMIEIPPGEFAMGSSQVELDELCQAIPFEDYKISFRSSAPQHEVRLTNGFYVGACEVTQQQFQDLMGTDGSYYSPQGEGKAYVVVRDTSQHPVEHVSWFDAVDFCNALSAKEELPAYYNRQGMAVIVLGGIGYRLPTEAEWEYACRAGSTTRWSFGDDKQYLERHAWIRTNSGGIPHPVGGLRPNRYGLHDLYGNSWEWCWDWHADYPSEPVTDPAGPAIGMELASRGGTFENDWFGANSCYRGRVPASETRAYGRWLGFRVAKTVETPGEAQAVSSPILAHRPPAQPGPKVQLDAYLHELPNIEQRVRIDPADVNSQNHLHTNYANIGNLRYQLGDYSAALASFQKSVPIAEKLAREHPANTGYQTSLGGDHCNLGTVYRALGRLDEALRSYESAASVLQIVLQSEPRNAAATFSFRNTCWGRAVVLGRLNRHAEAAANWKRAVELDRQQLIALRIGHAEALARAGDHPAAAAAAATVKENAQLSGADLYALARVYALSAAAAGNDDALAERYSSAAVNLLRRAQEGEWFADAAHRTSLRNDSDFAGLRDRDDFRTLFDQKFISKVPKSFSFDLDPKISDPEPGKRVWARIDDLTFVERFLSGTENKLRILGRTAAAGVEGTIVEKIGFERVQVFIPDRGNEKMEIKFRFVEKPNAWVSLGIMQEVE
jgi:formylglycine-generating enzyme required for sulfatase activity/tetratricopeptide (TPR) repeat protein/predicted Ser/Thr protein kinase